MKNNWQSSSEVENENRATQRRGSVRGLDNNDNQDPQSNRHACEDSQPQQKFKVIVDDGTSWDSSSTDNFPQTRQLVQQTQVQQGNLMKVQKTGSQLKFERGQMQNDRKSFQSNDEESWMSFEDQDEYRFYEDEDDDRKFDSYRRRNGREGDSQYFRNNYFDRKKNFGQSADEFCTEAQRDILELNTKVRLAQQNSRSHPSPPPSQAPGQHIQPQVSFQNQNFRKQVQTSEWNHSKTREHRSFNSITAGNDYPQVSKGRKVKIYPYICHDELKQLVTGTVKKVQNVQPGMLPLVKLKEGRQITGYVWEVYDEIKCVWEQLKIVGKVERFYSTWQPVDDNDDFFKSDWCAQQPKQPDSSNREQEFAKTRTSQKLERKQRAQCSQLQQKAKTGRCGQLNQDWGWLLGHEQEQELQQQQFALREGQYQQQVVRKNRGWEQEQGQLLAYGQGQGQLWDQGWGQDQLLEYGQGQGLGYRQGQAQGQRSRQPLLQKDPRYLKQQSQQQKQKEIQQLGAQMQILQKKQIARQLQGRQDKSMPNSFSEFYMQLKQGGVGKRATSDGQQQYGGMQVYDSDIWSSDEDQRSRHSLEYFQDLKQKQSCPVEKGRNAIPCESNLRYCPW
eukprot:TRINITY_DN17962_c1_g1_i4.p1 TRINITY_DN17962_c1_g1~~TRINITY_DN17962_c1_g1_i4.p1  ORF type:complete len:719 (-),score=89.18 TRINITY_DN17962_c1_g1_i4:352-2202(-)